MPAGWTVTTQVSTESQAASAIVKAGATTPVTVTATAPQNVEAGVYPIAVDVTSGSHSAHADLSAEVTGTYTLKLTTPDGVLSTPATAGSVTDLSLVGAERRDGPDHRDPVRRHGPEGLEGHLRTRHDRCRRRPAGDRHRPHDPVERRDRRRLRRHVQGDLGAGKRLDATSGSRSRPAAWRRRSASR